MSVFEKRKGGVRVLGEYAYGRAHQFRSDIGFVAPYGYYRSDDSSVRYLLQGAADLRRLPATWAAAQNRPFGTMEWSVRRVSDLVQSDKFYYCVGWAKHLKNEGPKILLVGKSKLAAEVAHATGDVVGKTQMTQTAKIRAKVKELGAQLIITGNTQRWGKRMPVPVVEVEESS